MYIVAIWYAGSDPTQQPAKFEKVTSYREGSDVLTLYFDNQRVSVGVVLRHVLMYRIEEVSRAPDQA